MQGGRRPVDDLRGRAVGVDHDVMWCWSETFRRRPLGVQHFAATKTEKTDTGSQWYLVCGQRLAVQAPLQVRGEGEINAADASTSAEPAGGLGAVASALGRIGADISLVEIVEKRGHVEIDEFILDLPPSQTVETLVAACDSLAGVQVQWVRNYPRGGGIELDVELSRRMAADSSRADEILVSAAPLVFRAQWSLLLHVSPAPRVVFSTPGAPDLGPDTAERFHPFDTIHRVALEPGWLPDWDAHHAVVAPLSAQRVVIIGRRGDPPFFRSELARLAYLTGNASTIDVSRPVSADAEPSPAHRRPVAPPLYLRDDASPADAAPG